MKYNISSSKSEKYQGSVSGNEVAHVIGDAVSRSSLLRRVKNDGVEVPRARALFLRLTPSSPLYQRTQSSAVAYRRRRNNDRRGEAIRTCERR